MILYKIIGYPLFFVSGLELLLGMILLRNNPRNSPINKAVAAFSFFSSAFSFFTAVMYIRAYLGLDFVLAAKATWVAWLSIPAALQFIYYLRDEKSRTARRIGLILYPFWSAVLVIALATNWIVAGPYSLIPFVYNPGFLDHPARLVAGSLILWLIIEIYLLRQRVAGVKKEQLDYFFLGTLIFAGGGSVMGAFLQLFGRIGFDPTLCSYFSFVWLLLTAYAITRYRLFDIPLMLTRTIGIALLLFIFLMIHAFLSNVLGPLLGAASADVISFFTMAVIFFGTPLPNSLQHGVDTIFLKRRYDYQQILKDSNQAIISMLDLDQLLQYLVNSIKKSLEVDVVHLFLRTKKDNYTARNSGGDHHTLNIDSDVIQVIKQSPYVMREELESLPSGKCFIKLLEVMRENEFEIMIPLLYKGDLQGILTLGKKGNKKPYIQSDVDLLQALASHASVAIENARLFKKAKQVEESLQESEQKFRALAETIGAGITINRDEKFLYVNPAAESLTGFARDEFLRSGFSCFVHPDYLKLVREHARARLERKPAPSQYEFKIVRRNGEERWVLVSIAEIQYEGEPATIAALIDITGHKQVEEDRTLFYEESLRQYQEKIDEEQKHQAEIRKILMDIHDGIGGITTNISMLSEIAQKASSPDQLTRALITISNLSKDGIAEIRSLMRSLDNKDLSWSSLIAELRSLGTSMLVPHAIAFEMTQEVKAGDNKPGSILCLNLFRIYREALTNIIKHARAGRVRVDIHIGGEELVLTIRDNGQGMPDTPADRKGRGIANMNSRAVEIGGRFTLSTDGGTSVCIEIPLSAPHVTIAD